MALIRSYESGSRQVRPHKSYTDCTYQIVHDANGEALLALSTFGSDDRKEKDTVSQSMQFNEEMSSRLLDSIFEAFPALRRS